MNGMVIVFTFSFFVFHRCDPSLRCLPQMDGTYTCQPKPLGKLLIMTQHPIHNRKTHYLHLNHELAILAKSMYALKGVCIILLLSVCLCFCLQSASQMKIVPLATSVAVHSPNMGPTTMTISGKLCLVTQCFCSRTRWS